MFGKSPSAETVQKIIVATSGEKNHNYGKSPSETTKQLLREAHQGEKSSRAILTEVLVLEIIELQKQGIPGAEIARRYGVSSETISAIKNKRSWRHLRR